MLIRPIATLRQMLGRWSAAEEPSEPARSPEPPEQRAATSGREFPPDRQRDLGDAVGEPRHAQAGARPPGVGHLIATFLGARAEETLDLLVEAISSGIAGEVARSMQTTREALSAEIAGVRDSAGATQREVSRMGRELVRTGATVESTQASIAQIAAVAERLEAAIQTEREGSRSREQDLRQEAWSEALEDILVTLDGLEAALDEAQALSGALADVARRLDDPAVRRWWRAMGEATGTKRALPAVPVADLENWQRGLELTYRRLRDALERRGIKPIAAAGHPFDPHLHEAVAVAPCPPEQDGMVLREERHGYRAVDRVIRLAQVVVGKATPPADNAPRRQGEVADAAQGGATGDDTVQDTTKE